MEAGRYGENPQKRGGPVHNLETFFLVPKSTIRDAIVQLDRNGKGLVMIVDADRRLIGTATDGDIRRAILANIELTEPVTAILTSRVKVRSNFTAVTAKVGTPTRDLLRLMTDQELRHIPLLNDSG